jgi:hypothetical protein
MRWSHPPDTPGAAAGDFEYELDVFVDLMEPDEEDDDPSDDSPDPDLMLPEAARRRLSNLGYCNGPEMQDDLKLFQRDLGFSPEEVTGSLDPQTVQQLREHHDNLRRPPALPIQR